MTMNDIDKSRSRSQNGFGGGVSHIMPKHCGSEPIHEKSEPEPREVMSGFISRRSKKGRSSKTVTITNDDLEGSSLR